MDYITRNIESTLKGAVNSSKAILLTGARQTGKSTLLRHLFPNRRMVTLGDPFSEEQARCDGRAFLSMNPPPVIIDEIQRTPNLFRFIKMACDESDHAGLFVLSGSQPFELMKDVSESLSGRIRILELSGLSLRELSGLSGNRPFVPSLSLLTSPPPAEMSVRGVWTVLQRGFYPALQRKGMDWDAYYGDYVTTDLERDIRSLATVHDHSSFRRFVVSAAARTGQILNCSNIADEVGKDVTTIRRWLSLLEASGIIYLLEPFASSALKRAIKAPKLYFRDTGLACYLTRWLTSESAEAGAMSGALFETFVVSEILKSYSNAGKDYRRFVSYYRGRDKIVKRKNGEVEAKEAEIDLIIEADGILYPVEIKNTSSPKADDAAAFPVLDAVPGKKRGVGAVVCACPRPGLLRENLLAVPVWCV